MDRPGCARVPASGLRRRCGDLLGGDRHQTAARRRRQLLSGERFWEDFEPGETLVLGARTITEEEIVEFARRYDPQPFHADPEAAKETVFGGLIASGWQTGALWMRMYVDAVLGSASRGSPGIEELRWLAPVRPGDTLTGTLTVLETTPSERDPTRGTVRIRAEMTNGDGVVVMRMTSRGHFGRRTPASGTTAA